MKKIIIGAAVLAVCAGGTAYAYQQLVEENPKNAYFKAEAQQMELTKRQMEQALKTDLLYTDVKTDSVPLRQKLQVSGKVKLDGMDAETEQKVEPLLDLLDKSALRFEQTIDEPKKRYQIKLGWDYNRKELLAVEGHISPKFTAIKVPQVMPEYVTLQNDKAGIFMKKLYPAYTGPDTLNLFDYFQTSQAQEADIKAYGKDYFKLIYENIKDSQVTSQKIEYTNPYGEKQKLKEYTLTLADSDIKGMLELLLAKAENDDKLLDFIVQRANPASRLPAVTATGAPVTLNKEELKKSISRLKENLNAVEFTGGFQMKTVTDKNGRIVDRKIETAFAGTGAETKEGAELAYASSQWAAGETVKGNFQISVKPTGESEGSKNGLFTLTDTYTYDSKQTDHELEWRLAAEGEQEKVSKADYHREAAEEAAGKLKIKQTVKIAPQSKGDQFGINISMDTTKTEAEGGKKTGTDSTVDITLDAKPAAGHGGKLNLKLAIAQEMEQLSDPFWPEFIAANSRELSAMTEEDMMELQNDIMDGFYQMLFTNEDLLELVGPFM
jgi:hypothetical protein